MSAQPEFTTRKDHFGFGLYRGALAANEIRGTLTAFSEGSGQESRFTLELPMAEKGTYEHQSA
jgi:two-component system NtrC family sensor kinase